MLRTSFNAVWEDEKSDHDVENNEYNCQLNGLHIKFAGNQPTPPLQYDDLVTLANLILQFQQQFTMPGFQFQYILSGKIYGNGQVLIPFTTNNPTEATMKD